MSIAQLQGMLRAIEERLNDGKPARIGGLLKADLLWVEGTQIDTPDLRLPNPDILGTDWGLEAFVAAAEDPFSQACKAGGESTIFCHEVGGKYRATQRTNTHEENPDLWFYDKSTNEEIVFGGVAVETTEDILAQSVAALALTGHVYNSPPTDKWDAVNLREYAEGRLRKVRSSEFVPVEASVRAGAGTGAVVESWLNAARAAADKAGVAVARAVVFEASADRVRGAILGAKIAGAQPAPLPPIKSIDVKRGDPPMEPARQPQVWSVELHVARPAPRATHPQGTHP